MLDCVSVGRRLWHRVTCCADVLVQTLVIKVCKRFIPSRYRAYRYVYRLEAVKVICVNDFYF